MYRYLAVAALACGWLRAETVLVLPFFNHSQSSNLDWIGESISESVNDSLASEGLLVLDRDDRLEAYRRLSLRPGAELTHASIIKIGQSLDAASVIYGSYDLISSRDSQPSSGSLRVNARLLDLKRLHQTPEFSETGALADLAALEARLGWRALQLLNPRAAPTEEAFMQARPPVRLDAVESYVRGLLAPTPAQRQRFFAQAARLDGHYSPPCFQLGMTYWASKDYPNAAMWLVRVDQSNPHYLEAQFFLGLCRYYTGDFDGAERAFLTVAAAVPLNEVYNDLAAAQTRLNDVAGALANFQKAVEGDSSDPDYHFNLGYLYWKSGRYDEAVTSLRAAVERNSADREAAALLGRALRREGPRPGEPSAELRERVKTNYEEAAYRQLEAVLENNK